MPTEERRALALEAIRPRIEMFHAALTVTIDQVRGLLAGSGNTADDQSAALGKFARGKMDLDRHPRLRVSTQKPKHLFGKRRAY